MTSPEDADVALKLLHTADWHLGRRFPSFDDAGQRQLMRARLDVIDNILDAAERHAVDAVVCAGDLFDEPDPEPVWWQGLARRFAERRTWPEERPLFLLPGNHDPLIRTSVYWPEHAFRAQLPSWVKVVDEPGYEYELGAEAVLYAEPCRSAAGQSDLALALPDRQPGDRRIRIGLVHGRTFDLDDRDSDFPIARDAAERRGLDYLAIGDTHGFREVPPNARIPTVYPGAPEPTAFDERDAGHVALVFFYRRRQHHRRPRIEKLRVGHWRWEEHTVSALSELRALVDRDDLRRRVLRLRVEIDVTLEEEVKVERLLAELKGTDADHGKAGVLTVERHLSLRTDDRAWLADLPPILRKVAERIDERRSDAPEVADRALSHLYRTLRQRRALGAQTAPEAGPSAPIAGPTGPTDLTAASGGDSAAEGDAVS